MGKRPSVIRANSSSFEGGGHAAAPGAEEQRLDGALGRAANATDEAQMIAAGEGVLGAAFEGGEAPRDDRRAVEALVEIQPVELVMGGRGEMPAQVALLGRQDVHREMLRREEAGEGGGETL